MTKKKVEDFSSFCARINRDTRMIYYLLLLCAGLFGVALAIILSDVVQACGV